jgi:hypothetical protein
VGNRAVEDAAVKYVMELERRAGREPADRRGDLTFAADVWSPPRTIEIKAVGKDQRGWFVPIETRQYDAARSDPDFFLYVVDNVRQGDPSAFRLKVFRGPQLQRLLEHAKKREYWEMPIPVGEFDSAPGPEAVAEADDAITTTREQRMVEFTEAMVDIYRNAKRKANYDAKVFIGMVAERGGLDTALYLIRSHKPSDGYTALYERGRLDLTVEALVMSGEWDDLFSEQDRSLARERLRAYGYRFEDRA